MGIKYGDNSNKASSFKNSIVRAVFKASPLPIAPDENVFEREIIGDEDKVLKVANNWVDKKGEFKK